MERAISKGVAALERTAIATEKMLKIAESEQIPVEVGPSVCANCQKLNPEVHLLEPAPGAHGPLDHFIIKVECQNCNHTIFAVAQGWVTFTDISVAVDWMSTGRAEA